MKVKKIKWDGTKMFVRWEDQKSTQTITHELNSTDMPSPEFAKFMKALIAPVLEVLELPDDYAERISFRGVTFSWPEKGGMGVTITLLKKLIDSNGPFVLNTPHLLDAGGNEGISLKMSKLINELLEYAEAYVGGGARTQGSLFEEPVGAEA